MEYQYPLVATNRDGATRIFYDADSFRAFAWDPANGGVGGYWREAYTHVFNSRGDLRLERVFSEDWRRTLRGVDNRWIVRDNQGRVVDKKLVGEPCWPRGKWSTFWDRRQEDKAHAAERGLPIPGTGHCRRYKHSRQGAWSKNGKNGAHNQRKGIKLYEDPKIKKGDFDEF